MRALLCPTSAIMAKAHKIARIVDHVLTHRTPFRDLSAADYEWRTRDRAIAALRKKAMRFGFALVEPPALVPGIRKFLSRVAASHPITAFCRYSH